MSGTSQYSRLPGGRLARLVTTMACVLLLGLCAAAAPRRGTADAYFPLDTGAVAVGTGGRLVGVDDRSQLVEGTRVRAGTPDSVRCAEEQRRWLAAGTIPVLPELEDSTLVRDALLDLHVLSAEGGVPVAGWAAPWHYVWPRDSALVAVALARTGHRRDAERIVSFWQGLQPGAAAFAARYRTDGTPVDDGRGPQSDSLGWVLWAMSEVVQVLPEPERVAFVERHRQLLDQSGRASLALVDNPRSLPAPSPDYWERTERRLTLSTAALTHAGLVATADMYDLLGEHRESATAAEAAARTAVAIRHHFAPGYPRTAGGSPRNVDLGVSFLLPPFVFGVDPQVAAVWRASDDKMARPAGGLAPGGSWRDDGVSWNTATSSHALTAAFVESRPEAVRRLKWLDDHRTAAGSLPEKVLADGSPASVAPLAWAAAAVVIAADELGSRAK